MTPHADLASSFEGALRDLFPSAFASAKFTHSPAHGWEVTGGLDEWVTGAGNIYVTFAGRGATDQEAASVAVTELSEKRRDVIARVTPVPGTHAALHVELNDRVRASGHVAWFSRPTSSEWRANIGTRERGKALVCERSEAGADPRAAMERVLA